MFSSSHLREWARQADSKSKKYKALAKKFREVANDLDKVISKPPKTFSGGPVLAYLCSDEFKSKLEKHRRMNWIAQKQL